MTLLVAHHIVWWVQIIVFVRCQGSPYWNNVTLCYNTSSNGYYCYTAPYNNSGTGPRFLQRNYTGASNWCKQYVQNSTLVVITSDEVQRNVERFLGRYPIHNDTVITEAQKLESSRWAWGFQQFEMKSEGIGNRKVAALEIVTSWQNGRSLSYRYDFYNSSTVLRDYICEYPEGHSALNNNRIRYSIFNSSILGNKKFTWYEARKRCLISGGDLASITVPYDMVDWSRVQRGQKLWIGLHRNEWIWKSIGTTTQHGGRPEFIYTNWENGYPGDSNGQCVCLNPVCKMSITSCGENDGNKWRICNCNSDYTVVCQRIMGSRYDSTYEHPFRMPTSENTTVLVKAITNKSTPRRNPRSTVSSTLTTTTTITTTPTKSTGTFVTPLSSLTKTLPKKPSAASSVVTYTPAGEPNKSVSSEVEHPLTIDIWSSTSTLEQISTEFNNVFLICLLVIVALFLFVVTVLVAVMIKQRKKLKRNVVHTTDDTVKANRAHSHHKESNFGQSYDLISENDGPRIALTKNLN